MRLYTSLVAMLTIASMALVSAPASAQYPARRPVSDRATGETYHVELGGDFWNPSPEIVIASESLGIIGSQVDFLSDLGIVKDRFREFRLVLRPARKHKFRLQYTPIRYEAEKVLERRIVFSGIAYDIGLPVRSSVNWRAWRIGYEYDFVYRDRGFVGFILEAKYTDVEVTLDSVIASEYTRARAPVPAIGGIGRVYVARNTSLTFELSGFELPQSLSDKYHVKYIELDIYGTVNFSDYVGAQIGYRTLDIDYTVEDDSGDLLLKGLYFGGVVRF